MKGRGDHRKRDRKNRGQVFEMESGEGRDVKNAEGLHGMRRFQQNLSQGGGQYINACLYVWLFAKCAVLLTTNVKLIIQ